MNSFAPLDYIRLLQPPYRTFEQFRAARFGRAKFKPGSLLAVRIATPDPDLHALKRTACILRSKNPDIALILSIDRFSSRISQSSKVFMELGFRAVLMDGQPILETLRPILTRPPDLGRDVRTWLAFRGIDLSPVLSRLVDATISLAPRYARSSLLLREIHESEGATRLRLRKERLPPPHAWLNLGRTLHGSLRIQEQPALSLLRIAVSLGYQDQSALSKQIAHAFEIRPSAIRGTIGWEWLLDRWTRRFVSLDTKGAQKRNARPASFSIT